MERETYPDLCSVPANAPLKTFPVARTRFVREARPVIGTSTIVVVWRRRRLIDHLRLNGRGRRNKRGCEREWNPDQSSTESHWRPPFEFAAPLALGAAQNGGWSIRGPARPHRPRRADPESRAR